MVQTLFPVYPTDVKMINLDIGVKPVGDKILYFNGGGVLYQHYKDDYQSFRYISSQMIVLGNVRQKDVIRFFKVSKSSVIRWQRVYNEKGAKGFFGTKKVKKGGNILTPEVLLKVQTDLNQGKSVKEIGDHFGIKPDTISKAIQSGRLTKPALEIIAPLEAKTQSQRSQQDIEAPMGVGCTNEVGRMDALKKKIVATPEFVNNIDVPYGGVLLSLPSLLNNGLLAHTDVFSFPTGYYSLTSILLSLSYCILLRIKSIERISDEPPGELGKLIGLDRIPEIKTLREKIAILSEHGQSEKWLGKLSKQWMQMNEDLAGVLYIDGHEDIYYGNKTNLPRHFISRLRLCMSATTDYWVCDKLGQPFFSISKAVNGSMIEVIKEEIVPRLEKDVPCQPSEATLLGDPFLHKFMIVYDREGYSFDFMIDMWDKRIACCTYNKYVKDLWSEEEFTQHEVVDQWGEKDTIMLAERGVLLEGKETEKLEEIEEVIYYEQTPEGLQSRTIHKRTRKKRQLWAREVRKLNADGHQTSILTTNYKLTMQLIGVYMFARWCQENFFKYMVYEFGLDMIISYFYTDIADTQQMVNPASRELEKQIRSLNTKLKHREAKFGALNYDKELDIKEFTDYSDKKAELQENISIYRNELEALKSKRDTIPKKINYSDLPEEEKFKGVHNQRKHIVDTIKLIAARSEMSLAAIVKKYMTTPKEARALLKQFYKTTADIKVDKNNKILQIKLHHQATVHEDNILQNLCEYLNTTETIFPETDLKLKFSLV